VPRPAHHRLSLVLLACCAAAAAPAPAAGDMWSRSVDGPITARQLGLPPDASPARLAHAAIRRSARRLAGGGRLGDVRFASRPLPPAATGRRLHGLRFQQQVGGLRVLYSQLDVTVEDGRVSSIAGTVVPLRRATLSGARNIGARQARRIARRAVAGADSARRAEPVAYAGEPGDPRRPKRAYVVEVAPATTGSDDSPAAVCVVVDAATGEVLKRWRGFAARPRGKRSATVAGAATKTVLIQIVDAKGTTADITPNYRDVYTMGAPRSFGLDSPLQVDTFGTLSPPFSTVNSWINAVTRYFCLFREYCGRDSGLDGSYNRHYYTVNWGASSRYVHSKERVFIDEDSTTQPQIVAHEQGHSIDFHFRDDYVATFEGDEVEEALAEMFAYDFEQDRRLAGVTGRRVSDVLADPTRYSDAGGTLPDHYDDYNCTTGEEHHNGYILAHGYWKLVQRVGHNVAGHVLQGVPWQLPARREFGDVRQAFARAAGSLLVPGLNGGPPRRVSAEVAAAFGEVGVVASSRRTGSCP
jgi:hypothetical protein